MCECAATNWSIRRSCGSRRTVVPELLWNTQVGVSAVGRNSCVRQLHEELESSKMELREYRKPETAAEVEGTDAWKNESRR